jgi:type II secretory pathway pseudopilin PulG
MASPSRKSSGGFTYLAALFMIMIMGIMLGAIGQSWSVLMKREREEELFFRGNQIKNAITAWYAPKPGKHVATAPKELKDLLKDPRSLTTVRYLRQLYTDPVTGEEWKVITGPVKGSAMIGIIGVASTSDEKPLKQADFPDDYKTFEGKTKYSEWQFVYGQAQPVQTQTPANLPTDPTWNRRNES